MPVHRTLPAWSSRFTDCQPPLLASSALICLPPPEHSLHAFSPSRRFDLVAFLHWHISINSTFRSFLTMPAPLLLCCSSFCLSLTRCTSRGHITFQKISG